MALTQKEIIERERQIGRQAQKMTNDYLQGLLQSKFRTGQRKDYAKIRSILKATRVSSRMGQHRLLGLNFTSSKQGFMQHYGFTGIRAGTVVMLKASRYHEAATNRRSSEMNLKPQNLFEDIYQKSGAAEYLLKALEETRTDAVMLQLQNMIMRIDKDTNDGK